MDFRTSDFGLRQPAQGTDAFAGGGATGLSALTARRNDMATQVRRIAPDGISAPWFRTTPQPTRTDDGESWNPFSGAGGPLGMLGTLLDTIQQTISNLIAQITRAFENQAAATAPGRAFNDAEVDSTGDPHIAVTGTTAGGTALNDRFDSMVGHADLVDANVSIPGGFQVSTSTTTPDANGVTYNRSATVTCNDGNDAVTFNGDGSSSIRSNGRTVDVQTGGSVQLDGGETVTKLQDGSLVVSANDGHGNTIATTLSANGHGVDVKTHARAMTLGGDAVAHAPR